MRSMLRNFALLSILVLAATSAFAQGTTATLTGTVTTDGAGLPGVTVTISSPALQGVRTTVTGEGGGYVFPALPPGRYTVKFELAGMGPVTRTAELNLAQTSRVDAAMKVSSITEAITVTAEAPSVLATPTVSTNFDAKTIEQLPTARTILATTQLAPGVQTSGVGGQTVINGAQSFDNLYLVNGVVVNDQLRGQPENLFIEDAIQETTLLASGVSAEFGRFTGGVVSTITKSGGNDFTGSVRDNMTNDAWTKKTVFHDPQTHKPQADPLDNINEIYEGTLGGRIIRDRLWFFAAGRSSKTSEQRQTPALNYAYVFGQDERRIEGKLTGNLTSKHSVTASYLDIQNKQTNYVYQTSQSIDAASLTNRELPNNLLSAHYNGVLTNNLFLEAQYSEKQFHFVGGGAETTDRIYGTLIRGIGTSYRAWSPTFCGVCEDKKRDNKDYIAKASYFLSTKGLGNHSIVGGVDVFSDIRNENNQQSGSNYRIWGDIITQGDQWFLHIQPGVKGSKTYIQYNPIAELSKGSDFKTKSVFLNDKWDFGTHFNFNIGVRYDKNDAVDEQGIKRADDSAFSPRLGVTYDVKGNGKHRFSASYGKYVSKLDTGIADAASAAGVPASIYYNYAGPEINASAPYLPTDEVIRQVFAWFDAQGGVDATNLIFYTALPGVDTKIGNNLKSPSMSELTGGYGIQLGNGGYLRADYINRSWNDFYELSKNLSTGTVTDPWGNPADLGIIVNDNGYFKRDYNGVQLQGQYRVGSGWFNRTTIGGNYTWSSLKGNIEGETSNNATVTSQNPHNYFPEYTGFAQFNPTGYLNEDVRHRANLWAGYDIPTPIGRFNVSLLERYHSGQAYSAVAQIDTRSKITNPGYVSPIGGGSTGATYFFSKRGEFRLDDIWRTDLALNYYLPITKAEVFVEGKIFNMTNNSGVEDPRFIRTTVYTSKQSGNLVAFNPYTDTPVRCTAFSSTGAPASSCKAAGANYLLHRDFGMPTSSNAYQLPRTYRVSFGVRF